VKTLLILIVIAAVAWFAWTHYHPNTDIIVSAGVSAAQSCASAASAAGDTWGSGVGRFANPPYDLNGWDDFRSRVEQQARRAEEKCLCAETACTTAKSAMNDLRSLVAEMDTALRSGSPPPSDLVQRQEAIDNAINSARDAAK
jgi:hypothetical protein